MKTKFAFTLSLIVNAVLLSAVGYMLAINIDVVTTPPLVSIQGTNMVLSVSAK